MACPECPNVTVIGWYLAEGSGPVYVASDLVVPSRANGVSSEETPRQSQQADPITNPASHKQVYSVNFSEKVIGLRLKEDEVGNGVVVDAFTKLGKELLPAEACGLLKCGDRLIKLNDASIASMNCSQVLDFIVDAPRPIKFTFERVGDGAGEIIRAEHIPWEPTTARSSIKD